MAKKKIMQLGWMIKHARILYITRFLVYIRIFHTKNHHLARIKRIKASEPN